jgi:hypothetical protein
MYNFTDVKGTQHIGDSLIYVNKNYANLDLWTQNILLSANNLWQPLVDLYKNHQNDWKESITIAQQNSAKWISVATTVEENSACWIKPLTLFYPDIYIQTTDKNVIKDTLTVWINQNFPVLPLYADSPNYIENQEAYVNVYNYYIVNSINETHNEISQTTCSTSDGTAYANCRTYFTGIARCSNGDMKCDGQSVDCPQTLSIECYYNSLPVGPYVVGGAGFKTQVITPGPVTTVDEDGNETTTTPEPYEITVYGANNGTGIGYINANINVTYSNRCETDFINVFRFAVRDCKWQFVY